MKKNLLLIAIVLFQTTFLYALNMELVTVGDLGNEADTRIMDDGTSAYGAVDSEYSIGKYEVTNSQYATFLNAVAKTDTYGLYNTSMGSYGISRSGSYGNYTYPVASSWKNKPVVYVSFYDTLRFINWLNNGQPTGTQGQGITETGAYNFDSQTNEYLGATHNAGATYWLPTENEWYKAAYYDPKLNGGGYWSFPTQSNSITTADANYDNFVGTLTDVGTYPLTSYYGTYDQAGNIWEWNETFIGGNRFFRGGRWVDPADHMSAYYRIGNGPTSEFSHIGFRVASSYSAVPEPVTVLLMITGLLGLILRKAK